MARRLWDALQELKDFIAYKELSYEGKEEFDRLVEKYHEVAVADAEGHPERINE